MRKIILASASKARRKLLKQIGLKFSVSTSNIRESFTLKKGCSDLVIANSLEKAKDVAARFDSGLVIAADTVVRAGRKIIGKPKDKKDAIKILRFISQRPQWVYTGITVIDIDNNKTFTGYDKTKIYMCRLSNEQINKYIEKTFVLDKAGSFDIQGLGAIFIDRIEGCYYNVVGLPLAKLARILKKTDIDIFS